MKLNKKQLALEFIASLPEGTSKEDAFNQFEILNPGLLRKSDFNHYMKNELVHYIAKVESNEIIPEENNSIINRNHVDSKFIRMTDAESDIDPIILVPMKTGTAFDKLITKRGGALRATVNMITGESGAGKTTVCTNIADYIEENNPGVTTGFISGEMEVVDWYEECADNKRLKNLETIFLLDYIDASNYMQVLEEALSRWDFVILDSFQVVLEQIMEVLGISSKKAESKLIGLMRRIAKEKNVCIFCINQFSKGGTYVGSTKIKHLTTAMMFVMFDKNGDRYLIFAKNRRNGYSVSKRLYFTKNRETGRIEFDDARLASQEFVENHKEQDKRELEANTQAFDLMLEEINNRQNATKSDTAKVLEMLEA